jgi:RES domain-containing protein
LNPLWQDAWWQSVAHAEAAVWRGVEAQHIVATMRLVDDLEEQDALEAILEASKPPGPPAPKGQHYLLATPFRYRSPTPSRFRRAGEAGIWYGAEELATACTELAYWRWRFLVDSDGLADSEVVTELTFFQARIAGLSIDVSASPWNEMTAAWTHPSDYSACQSLAQACRERGDVRWIRYWSARKVEGHCAAVLDPACLRMGDSRRQQNWIFKITRNAVLMAHERDRLSLRFDAHGKAVP